MRCKFKKEFKKEFNKKYEPIKEYDTLKEELLLQPVVNNNLVFKRKPFYAVSSLVLIMTMALSSLVTYAITTNCDLVKDANGYDFNALEMIKEDYSDYAIDEVYRFNYHSKYEIVLLNVWKNKNSYLIIYTENSRIIPDDVVKYKLTIDDELYVSRIYNPMFYHVYETTRKTNHEVNFVLFVDDLEIANYEIKF